MKRKPRELLLTRETIPLTASDICYMGAAAVFHAGRTGAGAASFTNGEDKAIKQIYRMADDLTDEELAKVLLVGTLVLGRRIEAKEREMKNNGMV